MRFLAGMLHNTATGRYHPIIFRPAPSFMDGDGPSEHGRFRSAFHHTAGFESEAEARAFVEANPGYVWTGTAWAWDGHGVPAMTAWFRNDLVEAVDG